MADEVILAHWYEKTDQRTGHRSRQPSASTRAEEVCEWQRSGDLHYGKGPRTRPIVGAHSFSKRRFIRL